MNKIYLFITFLCVASINAYAQPTVAANTPPVRVSTDVISLFSNAYSNVTIDTWSATWDQADVADVQIAGNDTKLYTNLGFAGVEFTTSLIDATTMQTFHIDVWTGNATEFKVKLVDFGANGIYQGGDDSEHELSLTPLTQNSWNSFDIPFASFTGLTARAHLAQMIFVGIPFGSSTVYVDNVYMYRAANAPTLSNFTIPAQLSNAAPFAITAPTSNSAGAFTYTSGNTAVATISGNTITILAAGTSVITATQAANGAYSSGMITASLVVTPAVSMPTVAAATPTQPAANVISLFSNAYTNVPVDTWKTPWTPAPTTLTDLQIAGNDTKLYGNLDFVGIEFVGPNLINATAMNHFHIDVWTPNATTFSVKLVDFGANGMFAGGDDTEHQLSLTPLTQSGWNSFDIPLSSFTGLTNRAHLAQMILVGIPSGSTTAYIDNVYFHNTPIAPPSAPTVAAPTPTRLAANVISLYSNAYTNVPVDTWSAVWDNADVADVQIAGNDNKLYTNLAFAGVEFTTTTVNATAMTSMHIDVWTPNATEFKVKLVDFGANGVYNGPGGDDSEHELTLTPLNQGAWNSFDIPFSSFTGLTARGHLAQMILVAVPGGTSTVYLDNVYFFNLPPTIPMVAAATPPNRLPADVISIYSDVYTPLAGVDMNPNWGQSTVVTDTTIATNPTKKYATLNYQGIQLAAPINLSTFEKLHVDFWTPNCTLFKVFLVNTSTMPTTEQAFDIIPTIAGWNSIDIPLTAYSSFVAAIDISAISQIKLESVPFGTGTVFLDNLYFFKGSPLPIVLANFDATKKGFTSVLDWKTTSETNNKGFYIQRSKNATNWENLTFINGAGNSSFDIDYTFTDNKPSVGVNYYRLKQEDFDGRFSTSDIKALRFNEKDALNFTVFPNPTSESIYIDLNNFNNGNAVVNLINEAGKIVYSKNINVNNGAFNSSIKVSSFAKGNYILQVKNKETNISKVLVIE